MSSNPYRKRLGPTTEANYRRALAAEPQLRAVDHLVTTMCTFVRPSDSLCHGCAWKRMVKPLVTRLVVPGQDVGDSGACLNEGEPPSGVWLVEGPTPARRFSCPTVMPGPRCTAAS